MKKLLIICSALLIVALLIPLMGAAATKSLVIEVSEDSYIIADVNDTADTYGYRSANYGSQEIVATWYLWNFEEQEAAVEEEEEAATEEEAAEGEGEAEAGAETEGEEAEPETVLVEKEKYISIAYLKFDLSQLEGKEIESAMLQLYPIEISLLSPRYVQAYLVSSDWDETTITYNTAPAWGETAIATTTIYQTEQWYGWDMTDDVADADSGQISVAVMLRDMEEASEELVAFPSREAGENASRLLVTYTASGSAWYWWVIGGVVLLALLAAAFFVGFKMMQRRQPAAK